MIKSHLISARKLSVLRIAVNLKGSVFDLDESLARPLGLTHEIVSETLGRLRRGGHISYHHWHDLSGKVCYMVDAVFTPVEDNPQLTLF